MMDNYIGLTPDPDTLETCRGLYDERKAQQAALEVAYYYQFGELPPWAVVLERIEVVNGGHIFIHRDPSQVQ